MATQGIVSIRVNDEMVMKVVAGSDGYNASKVAGALRERWPLNAEEAYGIAVDKIFGSVHDLVVLTVGEILYKGEEELDPRYRSTFSDPYFNPRWENGAADHVEVVDVDAKSPMVYRPRYRP